MAEGFEDMLDAVASADGLAMANKHAQIDRPFGDKLLVIQATLSKRSWIAPPRTSDLASLAFASHGPIEDGAKCRVTFRYK